MVEEDEEEYFEDDDMIVGGLFSTETFEMHLRIKGEDQAEEDAKKKPSCSICFEELCATNGRGKIDSCDHLFCYDCISEWAQRENSCPLCKVRFKKIQKCKIENGEEKVSASTKIRKKSQHNSPSYHVHVSPNVSDANASEVSSSSNRTERRSRRRNRRQLYRLRSGRRASAVRREALRRVEAEEREEENAAVRASSAAARRERAARRRRRRSASDTASTNVNVSTTSTRTRRRRNSRRSAPRSETPSSEVSGTSDLAWACPRCTFHNTGNSCACEMCLQDRPPASTVEVINLTSVEEAVASADQTRLTSDDNDDADTKRCTPRVVERDDSDRNKSNSENNENHRSKSSRARRSSSTSAFVWIQSATTGKWMRGRRRQKRIVADSETTPPCDENKEASAESNASIPSESATAPTPKIASSADRISNVLQSMDNLISSVSLSLSTRDVAK